MSPQCSGGTPPCERCGKKNIKCEFIPLQRAVSTGPTGAQATQTSNPTTHSSGRHGSQNTMIQGSIPSQISTSTHRGMVTAHPYSMPSSQQQSQQTAMASMHAGTGYTQAGYSSSYTASELSAMSDHYGHAFVPSQSIPNTYVQPSHGFPDSARYTNFDYQTMIDPQHGSQFVMPTQDRYGVIHSPPCPCGSLPDLF